MHASLINAVLLIAKKLFYMDFLSVVIIAASSAHFLVVFVSNPLLLITIEIHYVLSIDVRCLIAAV